MTHTKGRKICGKTLPILLMATACLGTNAAGAVINFDGVVNGATNQDRTTPLITQGFTFTSDHFHIIDAASACAFDGCAILNGSQYLAVDGPQLGLAVEMTRAGGGPFDVISVQASRLFVEGTAAALTNFPNAEELVLAGELAGGGTVSVSVALPALPGFNTFTLPPTFVNLTSLRISGLVAGLTDAASWGIDNIALNDDGDVTGADPAESGLPPVPEPGSALLLTPPLAVLLLRAKKRASLRAIE